MGWGGWGKGSMGGWGKGGMPDPWTFFSMMKGWGKGGGWGGKGGVWKSRKNSTPKLTVDENFAVTPNQVFTGIVTEYHKFSGYGFITLDTKGKVPEDKIFVYWDSISTSDRFPQLDKDMKVQCTIEKVKKGNAYTLRAASVTLPGGAVISLQDQADAAKKTFIGDQYLRYTGVCKFFDNKKGFGYITMDDGYALPEPVPKDLRVELAEVNAGGKSPAEMKDTKVEFGIWKTSKGAFKAYNVTAPGGIALPANERKWAD